jgi:hypothetical protein
MAMARRLIALIGTHRVDWDQAKPAPPSAASASDQRRLHAAELYFARTSNPVQVTHQAGKAIRCGGFVFPAEK